MSTAIEFNHVSKEYRLGLVSTRTLSNDLDRWWKMHVLGKEDPYLMIGSVNDRSKAADSDFVWALRDIDFKVEQGDVVGIIGKNGAGKSTLLKLLSRVTTPTTGTIKARGRIASLLEVGTGFHQELTGRENIYMNGAILGMTKNEINRKIDEIVDFSGCERYIDTPVKRYSSGMKVRLGFAVAAHLDPEILVVDEVLAVGDAEFQKKAIGKMQDISKGDGRTVLFVSHNMTSVRNLCKTGILLSDGTIDSSGNINDVIAKYLNNQNERSQLSISEIRDRKGNGILRFTDIKFLCQGVERESFKVGEECVVKITFNITDMMKECRNSKIDVGINTAIGERMAWLSSYMYTDKIDASRGEIQFKIPHLMLNPGVYNVNLYSEVDKEVADWVENVAQIKIYFQDYFGTGRKFPEITSVIGYSFLDYTLI
jgi:lipopolysaccharide transport system ATP-binding protein